MNLRQSFGLADKRDIGVRSRRRVAEIIQEETGTQNYFSDGSSESARRLVIEVPFLKRDSGKPDTGLGWGWDTGGFFGTRSDSPGTDNRNVAVDVDAVFFGASEEILPEAGGSFPVPFRHEQGLVFLGMLP